MFNRSILFTALIVTVYVLSISCTANGHKEKRSLMKVVWHWAYGSQYTPPPGPQSPYTQPPLTGDGGDGDNNGDNSWTTMPTEESVVDDTTTNSKTPVVVTTPTTEASEIESSSAAGSPLQTALWCRFPNGSYIPLGYTYQQSTCVQCQCLQNRLIRCIYSTCMVTYCIDGSTPTRYAGQCCTQCPGTPPAKSCTYQNVSYQAGTVIKQQQNVMQCYCQDGEIECRQYQANVFDDLNLFGDGTYIYVIVIIVAMLLIFGTLMCCGCTVFFYYYYQRHSQAILANYQQYWNSGAAGWQPMSDEQQAEEGGVSEEKQVEAERGQFETEAYLNQGGSTSAGEHMQQQATYPPPYALYNGSYKSEEQVHKT